jgi:F420-dependent oxidoreductase-like protein
MKLGLNVGYWRAGRDRDEQIQLAQAAEEFGYDSVWVAEAYGSDGVSVLAWIAAQTSRIGLGTAVLQMPGRSPAMTAMTAATIDQLSGGRMLLGLGTSGPQVAEGWHGQRFGRQLQRTREYFDVVRMALRRERLIYEGETLQLPLPDGPGKALKLMIEPAQAEIPLFLAAVGPRNTELAGEIADGWLPTMFSPEHVSQFLPLLQTGAQRAGRSLDDYRILPLVQTAIDDDLERARDLVRPTLALYIGGMGSRKQNFYKDIVSRYGFEAEAAKVQELYLDHEHDAAARALSDDLIDAVSLCGDRDRVRERMRAFAAAGVDTLVAVPASDDKAGQLRQLAELRDEL